MKDVNHKLDILIQGIEKLIATPVAPIAPVAPVLPIAPIAPITPIQPGYTPAFMSNFSEDHNLLIAVHEQLKQLRVEVKSLSENMDGRLSRVETTKLSASDFMNFRTEQVVANDKIDTRVKILETFRSVLMGAFIITNVIIVPILIWLVITALSSHKG